ncbi:hypothetical protein BO85DRAFT_487766 [Aspergillus piperis CBS 112811]|uniref:Zn(2)-C6 fungal-type domain-containing protein n=1 Tax=Aspergillus piperis CBS 112811 TaxID=1448313 RepID=A0A8G1R0Q8_9EURO|nr:hypothetical protein BO85DRAFT_487766 [Aspergillus piperis CBS 112811]RAH57941.1 hypothetical protein BO85DRAFT_487766 [Aspergillus piperis CBS 112811]
MPTRRDPCQHCRSDDNRPACTRCRISGRRCIRARPQLRFLNSTSAEYEHASGGQKQRSPTTSDVSFEYVDETPAVAALYQHEPTPSESHPPTPYPLISPTTIPLIPCTAPSQNTFLEPNPSSTIIHTPQAHLTLEEACLLRYFSETLGKWFDIGDPSQSFTTIVPQRARTSPPLLDAVLSASARHFSTLPQDQQLQITRRYGLSQGLTIDEPSTLHYHNRCIAHLRSVSTEPNAILDENLLAAVVTLRFYEELDTPFHPHPTTTAIRGLQVFLEAQARPTLTLTGDHSTSWGLRQSAFWVGVRQEFHMAFTQQRPFRIPLDILDLYPAPRGATSGDHEWVNALLILAAHVIQFCFDEGAARSVVAFKGLVERRDEWVRMCPGSFRAVYSDDGGGDGGGFPNRWYLDGCHIVAAQSLGFIRILLAMYNPLLLGVRAGRSMMMVEMEKEVKQVVWEVCGVAVSNRQSPAGMVIASFAVVVCAEWFDDEGEREMLRGFVREMRGECNYWPGVEMEKRLERMWSSRGG